MTPDEDDAAAAADDADVRGLLREIDELRATPNPETAPYASHYRIVEILRKWLSTPLPPREEAIAQAKLGATYLHVEEPHNAHVALDRAATLLCPELLAYVTEHTPRDPEIPSEPSDANNGTGDTAIPDLLAKLPLPTLATTQTEGYAPEVLELLSQLGILWSNRGLPLRALCYFHACAELAATLEAQQPTDDNHDDDNRKLRNALVLARTHAYFYLAQVFGTLQCPDESAQYCEATLELQLQVLIENPNGKTLSSDITTHEWVRNALRLVEYYLEQEQTEDAATCLYASEYLLRDHVDENMDPEDREQRHAEVFMAWAQVHQQSLQRAQFWDERRLHASPKVLPRRTMVSARIVPMRETLWRYAGGDREDLSGLSGLGMRYFDPERLVDSYDRAREAFKMGMSASEAALKVLVLDGFVSAHITLLQVQSQLYRRLIHWESDLKRRIAMHLRRLGLLTPLLGDQLNPRAYTARLQELYYESAEIASEIFDLKQQKGRAGPDDKSQAYALKAISWYQRYIILFYTTEDDAPPGASNKLIGSDKMLLGGDAVLLPPPSAGAMPMSPAEFKSLLHGYFALARVCSKVLLADREKTVVFWKKAMDYHGAVLALVRLYESQPGNAANAQRIHELYGPELGICQEMLELLPEKLDQYVYRGRALG